MRHSAIASCLQQLIPPITLDEVHKTAYLFTGMLDPRFLFVWQRTCSYHKELFSPHENSLYICERKRGQYVHKACQHIKGDCKLLGQQDSHLEHSRVTYPENKLLLQNERRAGVHCYRGHPRTTKTERLGMGSVGKLLYTMVDG